MTAKVTKWFAGSTKPVRNGVYQRKYRWGVDYAYFGKKGWSVAGDTPEEAEYWSNFRLHTFADKPWRGLAEKP